MKTVLIAGLLALLTPLPQQAAAQDAAAERARIANQRIIADSERRRIESEQRREQHDQESGSNLDDGGDPAAGSAERVPAAPAPAARPAPPRPPESVPVAETTAGSATDTPASRPAPPRPPIEPGMTAVSQGTTADSTQSISDNEAAPSPTPTAEMLEQLRDLGELRDAGYVTDDEFEAIKQRILNGGR